MRMKNVATGVLDREAGQARVMSVLRAPVLATFPASAANLVALPKSLTDIANGVEIPALGTQGPALQPFAAKLPR